MTDAAGSPSRARRRDGLPDRSSAPPAAERAPVDIARRIVALA